MGTKRQVWKGHAEKTSGGLGKADLMVNKNGKIVSRKQHQRGLEAYQQWGKPWRLACCKVRVLRGLQKGLCFKKGTEVYTHVKSVHEGSRNIF